QRAPEEEPAAQEPAARAPAQEPAAWPLQREPERPQPVVAAMRRPSQETRRRSDSSTSHTDESRRVARHPDLASASPAIETELSAETTGRRYPVFDARDPVFRRPLSLRLSDLFSSRYRRSSWTHRRRPLRLE